MPVTQSPYYTDPAIGQIGGALATALFGNPDLRAKQQLTQAQMDEYQASAERARAAAGYDHSRTVGQDAINTATTGLPAAFASMYAPPPAPEPVPAPQNIMPGAPDEVRPVAIPASTVAPDAPAFDPAKQFHDNLPGLLSAMVQSGHAADADKLVRTMGAFGGDDEMARRALVAGGASPNKDFAITPERADDIRGQGFNADYRKSTAVADIGADARRYAADRSLEGAKYGADASAGARRYAADRSLEGSQYGTDAHYGAPVSLSDVITSLYPGTPVNSGDRTQAQQDHLVEIGATKNHRSYHVPGYGGSAVDIPAIPGVSVDDVKANLSAHGFKVLEAFSETGKGRDQGTGPHWHIAIATQPGGRAGGGKAPPKMSAATVKVLQDSIAQTLGAVDQYDRDNKKMSSAWQNLDMDGQSKQRLLSRTQELAMSGLAPAEAAIEATREYTAAIKQNGGKLATRRPGEPFRAYAQNQQRPAAGGKVLNRIPPHAKRAPDGNLYALGTDGKYYRIEEQ